MHPARRRNFPVKKSTAHDMARVNYIADLLAQGATAELWGSNGLMAVVLNGQHVATTERATVTAARALGNGDPANG